MGRRADARARFELRRHTRRARPHRRAQWRREDRGGGASARRKVVEERRSRRTGGGEALRAAMKTRKGTKPLFKREVFVSSCFRGVPSFRVDERPASAGV